MYAIEFRGKDSSTHKWIYGSYIGVCNFGEPRIMSKVDNSLHKVIPGTVGLSTNCTDNTSKEIFTGDILRCINSNEETYVTEVRRDNSVPVIELRDEDADYTYMGWAFNDGSIVEAEVIGNIYDNPELLKDGE